MDPMRRTATVVAMSARIDTTRIDTRIDTTRIDTAS